MFLIHFIKENNNKSTILSLIALYVYIDYKIILLSLCIKKIIIHVFETLHSSIICSKQNYRIFKLAFTFYIIKIFYILK